MVQFQITGWYSDDKEIDDSSSDEDDNNQYKSKEFKIVLFGKDMEENTYTLLVNGFTPYFYVKVPNTFTKKDCALFEQGVRSEMWYRYKDGFLRTTMHQKMTFRNFNNNKNGVREQ